MYCLSCPEAAPVSSIELARILYNDGMHAVHGDTFMHMQRYAASPCRSGSPGRAGRLLVFHTARPSGVYGDGIDPMDGGV